MAVKEKLVAKERTIRGKQVRGLRRDGLTPLVMYGKDKQPQALEVDSHDFELLYRKAGGNTIVSIEVEKEDGAKETKNVLIHDIDKDPVKGFIRHADLLRINMKEKLATSVPLRFVGDSIAVMDLQGSLLTSLDEIEIECLPTDLPKELEVNISALADFDSVIHVSDIVIPEGVTVLTDLESVVAHVEAPRSDEELEALEEEVAAPEAPETEHGEEEATEESEKSDEAKSE